MSVTLKVAGSSPAGATYSSRCSVSVGAEVFLSITGRRTNAATLDCGPRVPGRGDAEQPVVHDADPLNARAQAGGGHGRERHDDPALADLARLGLGAGGADEHARDVAAQPAAA